MSDVKLDTVSEIAINALICVIDNQLMTIDDGLKEALDILLTGGDFTYAANKVSEVIGTTKSTIKAIDKLSVVFNSNLEG